MCGVTAEIFDVIGYLGSTVQPVASLIAYVNITTNLIVQSLVLGAGWPLTWEKVSAVDRLESKTSATTALLQNTIKEVEKDKV